MRSKTILSIAAFSIAFIVSAGFASLFIPADAYNYRATSCFTNHFESSNSAAIRSLLVQDIRNGIKLDRIIYSQGLSDHHDSVTFPDFVRVIEDYTDASNSLDDSRLPSEFRSAWRAHMKAWREYAVFLNEVESSRYGYKSESGNIAAQRVVYNAEINSTWEEVLRIGRTYNVNVE